MNVKDLLKQTIQEIENFEKEWDRLDSQGTLEALQQNISSKLEGLWKRKKFLEEFIEYQQQKKIKRRLKGKRK